MFGAPIVSLTSLTFQQAFVNVADVNGDGISDLVICNYNQLNSSGDVIYVLLGNGDGTFKRAASYIGPQSATSSLILADFDKDGKLDLAYFGTTSAISVMLGNGDGTFRSPANYSLGTSSTCYLRAGDFNGDGTVDLISIGCFLPTIAILPGKGDGTFGSPVNVATLPENFVEAAAVASGDFDGDGISDLVIAGGCPDGCLLVYLADGKGGFRTPAVYTELKNLPGLATSALSITDVNADGIPDIVVLSPGVPKSSLEVFPGNGDGTFQPPASYSNSISQPTSMALADLNRDGRVDVLLAGSGETQVLYGGPGPFPRVGVTQVGTFYAANIGSLAVAISNPLAMLRRLQGPSKSK